MQPDIMDIETDIKRDLSTHGDQGVLIPLSRLKELQANLVQLKAENELNHFQNFVVDELYSFDLPETDFQIQSILLVATPSPAVVELEFSMDGRRLSTVLPASYIDKFASPRRIEKYLAPWLAEHGYHILHAPRLPHKLLAVRSGLARYGRNNITYVEGMGSFINLNPFFTDMPNNSDAWGAIQSLPECVTCRRCCHVCPTQAILPERFLIDNERCLTYFNEADSQWHFPDWMDASIHHTLYGCLRCQTVCPVNQPYCHKKGISVSFDEEETRILLQGAHYEQLSEPLRTKVDALEMHDYLAALPRNLLALFEKVNIG